MQSMTPTGLSQEAAAAAAPSTATTGGRRKKTRREMYPAGLFTNDDGNLRFVAATVRHPCKFFFAILIVNIVMVVALFRSLVSSESGNPFSDPGGQYEINDIRSLEYDSLKLAVEDIKDIREGTDSRRSLMQETVSPQKKHHKSSFLDFWAANTKDKILAKSTARIAATASKYHSRSSSSSSRRSRYLQGPEKNRIQEQLLDITYWVYEAEGANSKGVFGSADSIRAMRESHDLFLQQSKYDTYCWREYETVIVVDDGGNNSTSAATNTTSKCRPPISALNVYYPRRYDPDVAAYVIDQLSDPVNVVRYNAVGLCIEFDLMCDTIPTEHNTSATFAWAHGLNANITVLSDAWDGTGELVDGMYIDQVTNLVAHLMQLRTKRGFVDFGFDKNFGSNNTVSMFSRAIFGWGGPLNQTSSKENDALSDEDREDEDEEALKEYAVDNFLDEMNEIAAPGHNDKVNTYYFMTTLILEVIFSIVIRDALMAIASFVFVFLYLRFTIGSWFLAIIGMAEIILSVPVSWFLYRLVFRVEYFAFLNVLALFIVAAIGADDIFIFMDAYKQSAHSDDPDVLENLESRMSWVYRRTGSAMFITSATTCAAFLCTLITPLVDIQAFGIFAATVIFIDYVLVMTLFCTAVVIYHNKFERPGCCSSCTNGCRTADPSTTTLAMQRIGSDDEKLDRVSRFFRNTVTPFIGSPISRIFIAILFVAWIVVAVIYAIQIEPTKEAEQFLRSDHPLQKSLTIINSAFLTTEEDLGLEVYFAWGLGEVDRDGVNQLTNPEFLGEPKFVDSFTFNEQCQTELLAACSTLRSNMKYQAHIKQDNGLGEVSCFVEEFAAYSVLGSLKDCASVMTGDWRSQSWQVPASDVAVTMASFLRERSCYSDEGLSTLNHYENEVGWDGTKLRFVAIALENSVVDPFSTLAEDTVRTEYNALLQIAGDLDQTVGSACGVGAGNFVMTDLDQKFIFMNNQSIYRSSALQSGLLGIGLAFAVLLVSTRVFHIAFLATICIACVLISVTGSMVLLGWTLGSTESILISIVAGFAVDYVVHLSHSYAQAYGNTDARVKTAFREMGISVLHGMVTSVGASIPLFFCQLTFFRKFGTFMFLTITFSWVFANLVFMSALAQFKLRVTKDDNDDNDDTTTKDAVTKPLDGDMNNDPGQGGGAEVDDNPRKSWTQSIKHIDADDDNSEVAA